MLVRYGAGLDGLIAAFTCAVLVVLSVIDVESRRLPNNIVLPSAALVLAARLLDCARALGDVDRRGGGRVRVLLPARARLPGRDGDGRREARATARLRARLGCAAGPHDRHARRRAGGVVLLVREGRDARGGRSRSDRSSPSGRSSRCSSTRRSGASGQSRSRRFVTCGRSLQLAIACLRRPSRPTRPREP